MVDCHGVAHPWRQLWVVVESIVAAQQDNVKVTGSYLCLSDALCSCWRNEPALVSTWGYERTVEPSMGSLMALMCLPVVCGLLMALLGGLLVTQMIRLRDG